MTSFASVFIAAVVVAQPLSGTRQPDECARRALQVHADRQAALQRVAWTGTVAVSNPRSAAADERFRSDYEQNLAQVEAQMLASLPAERTNDVHKLIQHRRDRMEDFLAVQHANASYTLAEQSSADFRACRRYLRQRDQRGLAALAAERGIPDEDLVNLSRSRTVWSEPEQGVELSEVAKSALWLNIRRFDEQELWRTLGIVSTSGLRAGAVRRCELREDRAVVRFEHAGVTVLAAEFEAAPPFRAVSQCIYADDGNPRVAYAYSDYRTTGGQEVPMHVVRRVWIDGELATEEVRTLTEITINDEVSPAPPVKIPGGFAVQTLAAADNATP